MNTNTARDTSSYDAALIKMEEVERRLERFSSWIHDKTSFEYEVIGPCLIESDLTVAICYHAVGDSNIPWIRPADEFFARFTPVI